MRARVLQRALPLILGILAGCASEPNMASHPAPAVRRLDGRMLTPKQVAATVERLMAAGKVPGLALAILNHGEIVYLRGFGLRDVEKRLPLTEETTMDAASFTKAMFAALVMQLVEEGAIDLDRPLSAYLKKPLPEYEKYADLAGDERWRRFTPRMLLS